VTQLLGFSRCFQQGGDQVPSEGCNHSWVTDVTLFCVSLLAACAILCAFSGCQREGDQPQGVSKEKMDNRTRILHALQSLIQSEDEQAFVIFEEKRTGKFVQFAGSIHQELFLDLPFETLDEDQVQRAESYFGELGVRQEESDLLDGPEGHKVGRQRSFQMTLGRDAEVATNITEQVFARVYRVRKDFELIVKTN
jgi:hypothetical protein